MRKSFIVHLDSLEVLEELSNEQSGILFKAIRDYANGIEPDLDFSMKLAFLPFRNQFIRDTEKYEKTCEIRRAAGSIGGKQKVANASKSKQKVANLADSDSKSKNDNKKDSDSNKENKNFNFKTSLINYGFNAELVNDWLIVRKNKKATNTLTAYESFISQVEKTNVDKNEILKICISKDWKGFNADWVRDMNLPKEKKEFVSNNPYFALCDYQPKDKPKIEDNEPEY